MAMSATGSCFVPSTEVTNEDLQKAFVVLKKNGQLSRKDRALLTGIIGQFCQLRYERQTFKTEWQTTKEKYVKVMERLLSVI